MQSWSPQMVAPITHLDMIKDSQGKILTKVSKDEYNQQKVISAQESVDHAAEMAKSLAKAEEERRRQEAEQQERLRLQ